MKPLKGTTGSAFGDWPLLGLQAPVGLRSPQSKQTVAFEGEGRKTGGGQTQDTGLPGPPPPPPGPPPECPFSPSLLSPPLPKPLPPLQSPTPRLSEVDQRNTFYLRLVPEGTPPAFICSTLAKNGLIQGGCREKRVNESFLSRKENKTGERVWGTGQGWGQLSRPPQPCIQPSHWPSSIRLAQTIAAWPAGGPHIPDRRAELRLFKLRLRFPAVLPGFAQLNSSLRL